MKLCEIRSASLDEPQGFLRVGSVVISVATSVIIQLQDILIA